MDQSRVEAGRALRGRAQGAKHEALTEGMHQIDPRLVEWSDGWIFGEVWSGEGAEFIDRVIVAIVALAATAKVDQLRNYLHGALQNGIEPRRVHETLMMLPVYVGFPTALQALIVWREAVLSARRRGMTIDL